MFCSFGKGPTLGDGNDLEINGNFNTSNSNFSRLLSYQQP